MKNSIQRIFRLAAFALLFTCVAATSVSAGDTRVFEMRTYYATPGKLDDLLKRFRDHTCKLFEKHGIENIGYWVPVDNTDNKLVYMVAYPSREAREKSWKAFMADPDWQAAYKESEKNGKLVSKVENPFMQVLDFSPMLKASKDGAERLFELRTYTAEEGRLDALNDRFRTDEAALFYKHGATGIGFWNLMKDQKGAGNTFIYMLAFKDKAARDATFKGFGGDPEWTRVRKASEEKAGGSLTVKGGVKNEFLMPTDFSPIK